jgi:hypothetical protein
VTLATRSSYLHLVRGTEVDELRLALERGQLPLDFESKLRRLDAGSLLERSVARHCRVFIELLIAAQNGLYIGAGPRECQRLLLVLAYVRKDDDACPDFKPHGFTDDQEEVHAAETELHALLKSFKSWRLRNQVPGMWLN